MYSLKYNEKKTKEGSEAKVINRDNAVKWLEETRELKKSLPVKMDFDLAKIKLSHVLNAID